MRSLVVAIILIACFGFAFSVSAEGATFQSKVDSLLSVSLPDTTTTTAPIYLYGTRYAPPHVREWRDHVLYCHGVQVCPVLKDPAPKPTATACERHALNCRADSAAKATGKAADTREAVEAMRLVYAASPLVSKAWYDEKGQLLVQFHSQRFPIGIGTPFGVDTQPGIEIDPYAEAESINLLLRNAWKSNRIVFIGSDYTSVVSSVDQAERQLVAAKNGEVTDGPIPKEALRDVIGLRGGQR
jgi:hypothetical protein